MGFQNNPLFVMLIGVPIESCFGDYVCHLLFSSPWVNEEATLGESSVSTGLFCPPVAVFLYLSKTGELNK